MSNWYDVDPENGVVPTELLDAITAIEKALTVDFRPLDASSRAASLLAMTSLRNTVEALDAHVVDAADTPDLYAVGPNGGSATLRAWLAARTNGRAGQLAARNHRARKLPAMPLVREAFEAGDITTDHVRVLGELTQRRFYPKFVEFEVQLVEWATVMAWNDFVKAIDAWKTAVDDREPDLKDESDQDARRVHLTRGLDHRGLLDGTLTPEVRVLVDGELRRISKQLLKHDRADAKARLGTDKVTSADLERTAAQRTHDALAIMAQRSNGADPGATMAAPIANIRTTMETVVAALQKTAGLDPDTVDPDRFECEFDDGTPLTYKQLVTYLIHARLHSVVLSQEGAVLHYGRGERWFTKLQKQAAAYRDRFCACGCGLLARYVDADHDLAWDDGGLTDVENVVMRCRTTHSRKTVFENHRRHMARRNQQAAARNERTRSVGIDDLPPPPVFGARSTGTDPP